MALPGAVMDAEHPGAVLRRLDEQRGRGTFCDVTIIVGDHKFRAHRNVLAASSPYFSELLFARGAESGSGGANRVLEISFVRAEVFAEILNFIYSSKLSTERGGGGAGGDDAALSELVSSGEKLGMRFLAGLEKSPGSPERRETPVPVPVPVPAPLAAETPRAPRPAPAVKKELSEKEAPEASDGPRILSSYSIPQMEKAAAAAKVAAVREARRENCPAPAAVVAPVPVPPAAPSSCSLYDVRSVLADAFLMALEHSYAVPPEPLRAMLNARCQGRRGTAPPPPGKPRGVPDAPRPLFGCGRCPRTFDGADSLRVHERSHRSFLVQCDHCRRPFMSERLLRAHTCLLRPPPPPLPPPPPVSVTADTASSCAVVKLVLPVAPPRGDGPAGVSDADGGGDDGGDDGGDGPPPCVRPPVPCAERGYGEPEAETRGVYNKSGSKPVFSGTLRRRRPSLEPDHYARVVEGQILYFCSVCDRSYVQLTSLKRHSNVHSWTKQYPCRYCERVFALAEYRTKHEIWHTGERRYQCIFCSEAFLTYHFLKTHQRTRHGVNPCKAAGGGGPPAAVAQDPLVRFYRLLPRQVNKRLYRTYRSADYGAPRAAVVDAPPALPPAVPPADAGLKVEEDASGTGSDEADDAVDGQITVSIADDRPDEEPYSPEPDLRPPRKRGRKRTLWTRDGGGAAGRRERDEDSDDSDQEWKDSSWKPYYSYKPKRKGPRGPRGRRRRRGWRGTTRSSGAFGFGSGEAESSGGGSEPGYATRRRAVEAEAAGAAAAGRPDAAAESAGGFGTSAVVEPRAMTPPPWARAGQGEGLAAGAEPEARQPVRLSHGGDDDGGGAVENSTRDEADSGEAAAAHGFYTVDGRGVRRSAEDIAIAEKLLQMGELTPLTPPPPPPPPPPVPRPAYLDPRDGNDVLLDLTFGKHRVAHCDPGPARPLWADAGNGKCAFETPNDNLGYFGASGRGEDECRGLDLRTNKEHVVADGCGLDGIPSPCSSDEEGCAPASAVEHAPSSRLVKGMYPCVYCDKVFPFRCRWMKHQLADHNSKTLNQQMLANSAAAKENRDEAPGDVADGRRGGGRWGGPAEQRPWEPGARPHSDGAGPGGGGRTGEERGEFKCFYCPRVLRTPASRSAHHTWHRRWLKAAERRAKFCPPPRADDLADRRRRCPPRPDAFDAPDSPAARRHRRRERRPAPPADPAGPSRGWSGAPRGEKFRCCCCPRVLKTAAARALHQKSHGMTASPPGCVRHVAAAAPVAAAAYEQAL